jgi:hypothetical protein
MMRKYTKAQAISLDTTYDPPPDAIWVGSGSTTDDTSVSDLGSPDIWIRADSGTTLSGSVITGLVPKHPTGIGVPNWSATTGDSGPTLISGDKTTNYEPFFRFNGSSDGLQSGTNHALFQQGTAGFTVIIMVKFDGTGTAECPIAKDGSDTLIKEWSIRKETNDTVKAQIAGADPVSAALSAATWYIIEWSKKASDSVHTIYINGVASGSTATAATNFDDAEPLSIGRRGNSAAYANYFNGDMTEILYYNDVEISSATRTAVVAYLQDRYSNVKKATIAATLSVDSGSATTKSLKVGEVSHLSPASIATSGTTAGDVIGLWED